MNDLQGVLFDGLSWAQLRAHWSTPEAVSGLLVIMANGIDDVRVEPALTDYWRLEIPGQQPDGRAGWVYIESSGRLSSRLLEDDEERDATARLLLAGGHPVSFTSAEGVLTIRLGVRAQ